MHGLTRRPKLTVERRALVVVAGLPGSGKSTMLRETEATVPIVVLDSDQVRKRFGQWLPGTPYRRYRPLVHIVHRSRVMLHAAIVRGPVVVHDPATGAGTRLWLLSLGLLTRRPRHLVWVDCTPAQALSGQHARGRVLREPSFSRHVRRATRLRVRLRAGRVPFGWHSATVIDRDAACRGLDLLAGQRRVGRPRSVDHQ